MKVSIQLWSVRDEFAGDYKKTLSAMGEYGYYGVEFAGYGGAAASELADVLKSCGLASVGTHTRLDVISDCFPAELEFNRQLGSKYIVCPGVHLNSVIEVESLVNVLNTRGREAAEHGIKIGYHNHEHEFRRLDGKYILDLIAENTSDDVILELDVYWAQFAGVDPLQYIEKWGKKIELVHLKQIGENNANVNLPDGYIDMKKIIGCSKYATNFIVEQEEYTVSPMDSAKVNMEYLAEF